MRYTTSAGLYVCTMHLCIFFSTTIYRYILFSMGLLGYFNTALQYVALK